MRILLALTLLLSPLFAAAQQPTLVERFDLAALTALQIVSSKGDATHATYQLVSRRGVRPVLGALEKKLLGEGWLSHPNLTGGPADKPAPNALLPDNRGRQLVTFVQGSELLEVLAAPIGRSNLVSLRLNLIATEPSRPVVSLPGGVI